MSLSVYRKLCSVIVHFQVTFKFLWTHMESVLIGISPPAVEYLRAYVKQSKEWSWYSRSTFWTKRVKSNSPADFVLLLVKVVKVPIKLIENVKRTFRHLPSSTRSVRLV